MIGTLVNTLAAVVGGLLGTLLKKGIPERLADLVKKGLALCVLYIGIKGSFAGTNTLVTILSMVLGAIIGGLLDLDDKLEALGAWVQSRFAKKGSGSKLAEGFVTASLLFCVGSMAVVGSLQSGLTGNHETIFTKSMLDFVSAIILASSLGLGVCLSGAFVLVYQGAIVLLARWAAPILSDYVVAEMSCAGSLLIVALGLNMLGITKLKVSNLLPAMFLPLILCLFMK
ncbi:MAG: DUF554 domain-containing protein [Oscillospiraceae bacterium]|nr:DUF554 domain-containing protein [Oscillospiraceae bacterium]